VEAGCSAYQNNENEIISMASFFFFWRDGLRRDRVESDKALGEVYGEMKLSINQIIIIISIFSANNIKK